MSICDNFEGALMKAIRSLEQHVDSLMSYDFSELSDAELDAQLHVVDDRRIWVIAEALRRGVTYDHIFEMSRDPKMLGLTGTIAAVRGDIRYSYLYGYTTSNDVNLMELYMKEVTLSPFFLAPYSLPRAVSVMILRSRFVMATFVVVSRRLMHSAMEKPSSRFASFF